MEYMIELIGHFYYYNHITKIKVTQKPITTGFAATHRHREAHTILHLYYCTTKDGKPTVIKVWLKKYIWVYIIFKGTREHIYISVV